MSWLRLALRLQKFELIALALLVTAWSVVALFIAWRFSGFVAEFPDCLGLTTTTADYCEDASVIFGAWDQTAEALLWLVIAIPLFIGTILGVPVVAREVEQQTAQLAWSFSLSRTRWLAGRTAPILLLGLVLLTVLASAGEILAVARLAGDDPGFQRYDQRGVLVVVRGVVAMAVAVLVGAWMGRLLPAILAAATLTAFIVFGTVVALDVWRRAEAEVIPLNDAASEATLRNGMIIEPVAILPDGSMTSDRSAQLPEGASFNAVRIIPSGEYWVWVGRETAALALIGVALTAASVAVVRRRRPM